MLAFSKYPSFSPMCASCITDTGRWLLEVLRGVSSAYPGCSAVYGDTDSAMSSYDERDDWTIPPQDLPLSEGMKMSSCMKAIEGISDIFSNILSFTPFANVRVSPVKPTDPKASIVYESMIVLGSKNYAMCDSLGGLTVVGGASVRRNTPPIQVKYTEMFLRRSLKVSSRDMLAKLILDMALHLRQMESMMRGGRMSLSELATKTTRGGMTRFQYMGSMGAMVVLARAKTIDSRFEDPAGMVSAMATYYTNPCYEFCCNILECFGYTQQLIRGSLLTNNGAVQTSLSRSPLPRPNYSPHSG